MADEFKGKNPRISHTWSECLAYVQAPRDAWNKGDERASRRKAKGDGSFHALPSYQDAQAAMRLGWQPGRERIQGEMSAALAGVRTERVPAYRMDVAGERPNVALAVTGDPRCMYRRRPNVPRARPVVRVLVNVGAVWVVEPEHLARRGAAILAWLDALEAAGWTTSLDAVWVASSLSSKGGGSIHYRVGLKAAGERFDLDRLSFALVCPDFLRRACFSVLEACPDLSGFFHGYGKQEDLPRDQIGDQVYFGAVHSSGPWRTTESALANVRVAIAAARQEVLA